MNIYINQYHFLYLSYNNIPGLINKLLLKIGLAPTNRRHFDPRIKIKPARDFDLDFCAVFSFLAPVFTILRRFLSRKLSR